jgi:hypothetical protein
VTVDDVHRTSLTLFAPILSQLVNLSLSEDQFPKRYKIAQVLPLLKKPRLDRSLPSNYLPISYLSAISKVLERLLLLQLRIHASAAVG